MAWQRQPLSHSREEALAIPVLGPLLAVPLEEAHPLYGAAAGFSKWHAPMNQCIPVAAGVNREVPVHDLS